MAAMTPAHHAMADRHLELGREVAAIDAEWDARVATLRATTEDGGMAAAIGGHALKRAHTADRVRALKAYADDIRDPDRSRTYDRIKAIEREFTGHRDALDAIAGLGADAAHYQHQGVYQAVADEARQQELAALESYLVRHLLGYDSIYETVRAEDFPPYRDGGAGSTGVAVAR